MIWVGPAVVLFIWTAMFVGVIVSNFRIRRLAAAGERPRQTSWLNFVPILVIALTLQVLLNWWRLWLGDAIVLAFHVAAFVLVVFQNRRG